MSRFEKVFWLCCIFCWCKISSFVVAIQINYVKVPNAVKNDSNRPVVLDCNYSIRPDDTELIVKWYLNEELVYQWIPPQKPQSLGVLKNGVDLEYKATDDPKTVYRAIKINNPTTDIAGEYKCQVSTLIDEDFSMKNMIVFEPESYLSIRKTMNEKFVNFTCLAADVYPPPKLALYKDLNNNFHDKIRISITEWDIKKNPETQKYTMFIVGTDRVSQLDPGTLIHCELKIPGTGYVKSKSLLYYPHSNQTGNGCYNQCTSRNYGTKIFFVSVLFLKINL